MTNDDRGDNKVECQRSADLKGTPWPSDLAQSGVDLDLRSINRMKRSEPLAGVIRRSTAVPDIAHSPVGPTDQRLRACSTSNVA